MIRSGEKFQNMIGKNEILPTTPENGEKLEQSDVLGKRSINLEGQVKGLMDMFEKY